MTTITEDYVSFETAKLLREKGFSGECLSMYLTPKPHCGMGNPNEAKIAPHGRDSHYYEGYLYQCEAPTLQMAMKWLREVHKLHFQIWILEEKGYWFDIEKILNAEYKHKSLYSTGLEDIYFETYEQACEAAIKYCLENLI